MFRIECFSKVRRAARSGVGIACGDTEEMPC
jgi:hypothetical protein